MKPIFRLIGSFLVICGMLNIVSYMAVQSQLLSSDEIAQHSEGKTFWKWEMPDGREAQIHYVEKGSGSNHIVLIHGFRANTFTWRYLINPLAEAGFHVWSIDLLGYGFSDKPDINYDIDLFTHQIKDFVNSHQIKRAHFIGNSMGGGLCLNMALHHPEHISSLILISALGYPLDLPLYVSVGKYFSMLWTPFIGPAVIRKGLQQLVYHESSISEEQIQAYTLPYFFPGGSNAALSTLKNFDNRRIMSMTQRYSEIACPLLVIWGEHDPLIPVDHFEQFCKDFPAAEKLLISECGHIPQEEKSEQTLEKICSFLKSF